LRSTGVRVVVPRGLHRSLLERVLTKLKAVPPARPAPPPLNRGYFEMDEELARCRTGGYDRPAGLDDDEPGRKR
jgi:hypothetical protein